MKFMSNTKRLYLQHITWPVCKNWKSWPVFFSFFPPASPTTSGQIREQPVRGQRYLRVSLPSAEFEARGERGVQPPPPLMLPLFLFFCEALMCGSKGAAPEVNRTVWSSGNLSRMTSSESSQEWKRKGNLLPGRKWRDLKEKMLGRDCSVGVNSGAVDCTQCEILSLSVQGILLVKV